MPPIVVVGAQIAGLAGNEETVDNLPANSKTENRLAIREELTNDLRQTPYRNRSSRQLDQRELQSFTARPGAGVIYNLHARLLVG